jgi:NADP-dependent 3-hydroxy acid dehydrogenase YdfG
VRLEGTLTGRAFVVAGAASGIGQATAELLVEGGALVALVDRDIERLASISGTLGADRVLALPVDVTDEAQVAEEIHRVRARFHRLDGVVTSAGLFDPGDLAPLEDLELVPRQATFARFTSSRSAWSCALRFRQMM